MVRITVSIDVPDLERATNFYVAALGCAKCRDEPPHMTVLFAGNVEIYPLEKAEGSSPLLNGKAVRSYRRHWTPVHLDFVVEDIEASLASVLAAGGSHEGGDSGEWGQIAYCADPFGNGFDLIKE